MRRLILFSSLAVLATSGLAAENLFEKIGSSFGSAAIPNSKDLAGYWAGRCVTEAEPDKLYAAVLVHKVVKDEADFPPVRAGLSYFFSKSAKPNHFDTLSPGQIETDPQTRPWFSKEQWQGVFVQDGSLVNYFQVSDSLRIRRAVRVLETQFDRSVLLKVSRLSTTGDTVTETTATHCYFNNFRGKTPMVEQPPIDVVDDMGALGPIRNQWVSFGNPRPELGLRWFELTNAGREVIEIRDLSWIDFSGLKAQDAKDHRLLPGGKIRFSLEGAKHFTVRRVDLFVAGYTPRLEIRSAVYTVPAP